MLGGLYPVRIRDRRNVTPAYAARLRGHIPTQANVRINRLSLLDMSTIRILASEGSCARLCIAEGTALLLPDPATVGVLAA